MSVAEIERSLVSGARLGLFEELVDRWREAYDPPRVFWQTDQLYRVEYARRQLAQSRERLRQALAQHARYEEEARQRAAALQVAQMERAAWRASPEGKAQAAWSEAKRQAEREREHLEDMAIRRYRLPIWAEWAAWRVSKKETARAIADELGMSHRAISRAVMDYVYLNHPDVTAEWHKYCPLDSGVRRVWLKRYFRDRSEPAFPGRADVPAEPPPEGDYRARNEWVYRRHLAGRPVREIAAALGISRTRVDQICRTQQELDRKRHENWPKPKPWRALENKGRPVDMGGPREVWLTYYPPADARLDNMEPVRP